MQDVARNIQTSKNMIDLSNLPLC